MGKIKRGELSCSQARDTQEPFMDKFVAVAVKISHNNGVFTYRVNNATNESYIGKRVHITIKNRATIGVIIDEMPEHQLSSTVKIKDVVTIIDEESVLTDEQMALMRFCASYYFNPLGPVVHLGLPRHTRAPKKNAPKHSSTTLNALPFQLNQQQQSVIDTILATSSGAYLLEGVTGSGKTLVYIAAAHQTLKEHRAVLVLVPEISLTPQLVKRFEEALGIKAEVLHSYVTIANKRDAFAAILAGAPLVIGARSALFSPIKNLGLIIVDEEHDASLKQDESPRYHARDLALWRAKHEGARIILGSATPSLETIVNTHKGKLTHLQLPFRHNIEQIMPTVTIIDLKERAKDVDFRSHDRSQSYGHKICILSRPLVEKMRETIAAGAQVLLFLNQRGYAKFGVCYDCGQTVSCKNCSVSLTYYQNRRSLLCHQCLHTEHATTLCRHCQHDSVNFLGLGTERLEEEVRTHFPDQVILRLDRDVVRTKRRLEDTLSAMHQKQADILIGTQMIAKGHDFLHVGLVGVICADTALSMPDFRAAEKTFQLLTQVAGRAGRGEIAGHAMIQTFDPHHPSIKFASHHNVKDFIALELKLRKQFNQPPFTRAALIRVEHTNAMVASDLIDKSFAILKASKLVETMGPAPSPIEKINQRFRFQGLVLAKEIQLLHKALAHLQNDKEITSIIAKRRARFIIDVDPINLT